MERTSGKLGSDVWSIVTKKDHYNNSYNLYKNGKLKEPCAIKKSKKREFIYLLFARHCENYDYTGSTLRFN